jgi:hypothetical protein
MTEDKLYPIIDFDPDREAIIRPFMTETPPDFPELVVMCFFKEVLKRLQNNTRLKRFISEVRGGSGSLL